MRKSIFTKLGLILLAFSLLISCEEEAPKADFTAKIIERNGVAYVTFSDESNNNTIIRKWIFEGGSPAWSYEKNPTIRYDEIGIYNVKLQVANEEGTDEIIKNNFVNIVSFINTMSTDATIKMENELVTLKANSECLVPSFRSIYNCHIETSGKKLNGEQAGLLIYWDFGVDIKAYNIYEFGISPELVFFNMTNSSNVNFTHFMANRGNPNLESLEEIPIPNDGIKHELGYYIANDGMEVRAYSPEGYVLWSDNDSFYIPWTNNQVVNLVFDQTLKEGNSKIIDSKVYSTEKFKSKSQQNTMIEQGTKIVTETGYK